MANSLIHRLVRATQHNLARGVLYRILETLSPFLFNNLRRFLIPVPYTRNPAQGDLLREPSALPVFSEQQYDK